MLPRPSVRSMVVQYSTRLVLVHYGPDIRFRPRHVVQTRLEESGYGRLHWSGFDRVSGELLGSAGESATRMPDEKREYDADKRTRYSFEQQLPERSDISSAVQAFTVGILGNMYSRIARGSAFPSMVCPPSSPYRIEPARLTLQSSFIANPGRRYSSGRP
jgi:hypothetical protein